MGNVEVIEFNGFIYRRYPNAKTLNANTYFHLDRKDRGKAPNSLHRAIWQYHNGPIPKGYVIHHIDENPLNNDLFNLRCMTISDHRKLHLTFEKCHARGKKSWENKEKIQRICILCSEPYWVFKGLHSRFCSPSCLTEARYRSGKDNIEKECEECKKMFNCNKYKIRSTCSRPCADAKSSKTKSGKKLGGELRRRICRSGNDRSD